MISLYTLHIDVQVLYKIAVMNITPLDVVRRSYAEEIRRAVNVRSPALVDAFASVAREDYLGPGPWKIGGVDPQRPGSVTYRDTPDADPRHVYQNALIAIDAARGLNNGHPSSLALWLDALALKAGDNVLHVGCGVGYYTAIAATVVGPTGSVTAIEIDGGLAARARANLSALPHVAVISTDGAGYRPPAPCDAILVNAGFTHPLPVWLDALGDSGRLLVPVTTSIPASPISAGGMLLVTRAAARFRARFVSPVAIFASPKGRDENVSALVRQAFATGAWLHVTSLRVDAHEGGETCVVHVDGACLSSAS